MSTRVPDAPGAWTEASRRVAIYGGAFDPPHLAHVFTLTWLLQRTDLDEIWLLPAAAHAFGKRLTPFEDRVGMLAAIVAALGSTRLHICTIEHEVTLSGRTYDTLEALQARHPTHQFRLVIGADNLSEAHRWHRFEDLVARWSVIALGATWPRGEPGAVCPGTLVHGRPHAARDLLHPAARGPRRRHGRSRGPGMAAGGVPALDRPPLPPTGPRWPAGLDSGGGSAGAHPRRRVAGGRGHGGGCLEPQPARRGHRGGAAAGPPGGRCLGPRGE